ncbi:hypothetical protein EVG20_g6725 [Dentipellis fragilis]|uniref:Uncharacterized protein n=1 Tax=Dentipellis fragilis TaxID=205917 RepID=A0A4Y9YIL4_9AGAM|nr:hypothetical protein EVG20_g6725 [Dentipellis fragilis]
MSRGRPQLNRGLEEAAVLIASSDPSKRKISKTERFLDRSGDLIGAASGLAAANTVVQNNASAIVSVLKLEAGDFIQASKILVSALDEVAKLHPFISVAVLVFKTAVNLVIKRRENDGKVLALNVQMRDMMSTLLMLKGLTNSESDDAQPKEMTIETRLADRMTAMVTSMKDCSKVCDSYNKNRVVLKILSSYKWEQKFAAIAKQFATHSAKLQDDLSMYSSIGINAANKSLAVLSEKMDEVMATVFKTFQSAEERQIGALVASKGGPEKVAGDNAALEQLLLKQKELEDGPGKKDHTGTMTVSELRKDMRKDVQTVLDENSRAFSQKFEIQQRQIAEEMKNAVFEARDDIIDAVLAGPYERDMRAIWKDMGWKGSVKARHLVLAVHDHFTEQRQTRRPANGSLPEDTDAVKTNTSDEWALEYINIIRIQPLIEAMDDDVSSFVTISEVNAFTRARPVDWSLPYWIAYNTIGVELSINFYYHRLNRMQLEIFQASKHVLPANRNAVNNFISSPYVDAFDGILSGIQESVTERSFDWDTDPLFLKFRSYILDEEERMRVVLESFDYYLDDESTLRLVSDTSRPEKYVLAVLCILYNRYLQIVEEASKRVLEEDALSSIDESLDTIWTVIVNRAVSLRAIFQLQNLNCNDQMEKYCFGMYRFALEDVTYEGKYWQQRGDFSLNGYEDSESDTSSDTDGQESENSFAEEDTPPVSAFTADGYADIPSPLDSASVAMGIPSYESRPGSEAAPPTGNTEFEFAPESGLDRFFRPKMDDFPVYRTPPAVYISSEVSPPSASSRSIIGIWSGRHLENSVPGSAFTFTVSEEEPDGSFTGFGIDNIGNFLFKGSRDQDKMELTKTYTPKIESSDTFKGTFNDSFDRVDGEWGSIDGGAGAFFFLKKPLVYVVCRPEDEGFEANKPRALWKFAMDAAMRVARRKVFTWSTIRERRDTRRRFLELQLKSTEFSGLERDEFEELEHLNFVTDPEDLGYWLAILRFIRPPTFCDNCHTVPIKTTRMTCLECSQGDTTDFCVDCFDQSVRIDRDNVKALHTSAHSILQLRSTTPARYSYFILDKARSIVSLAQSRLRPLGREGPKTPTTPSRPKSAQLSIESKCMSCSMSVSAPFWCCLTCEDPHEEGVPAVVCLDCNSRVEKEEPWLFERVVSSPEVHNWAHSLVLVHSPQDEALEVSTEERLQSLEDTLQLLGHRIEGVESMITTRFQAMERLVMELVDASSRDQVGH